MNVLKPVPSIDGFGERTDPRKSRPSPLSFTRPGGSVPHDSVSGPHRPHDHAAQQHAAHRANDGHGERAQFGRTFVAHVGRIWRGSGIATRCPETSSRCVLMPYGVQVINVSRSSPGTIFNRETSSGSITLIRSTSYPSVSSITLMYMKSPSCSSSSRVNINDLTRPRCPVTTVCESVPPTGRLVPYRCPAPTASTGSDVPCRIGSSTPILGTNTVP